MSNQIYIIGLALLAFFCGCTSSMAQVDTSALIQINRLRFDYVSSYWLAELDTNRVGILDEKLEWIIPPVYCAIADFDPLQMIVSARSCPFENRVSQMSYWADPPLMGSWGIVNAKGDWLVDPVYTAPLTLDSSLQMPFNYSLFRQDIVYQLKTIWSDEYDLMIRFGDKGFVLNKNNEIGIRKLNGEWAVPYGKYQIIILHNHVFLIPDKLGDHMLEFPILKLFSDLGQDKIWSYVSFLEETKSLSNQNHLEYGYDSTNVEKNKHLLSNDSIFGKWFYERFWFDLFESREEALSQPVSGYEEFDGVFADSIYAKLPDGWYPFERVEESDCQLDVVKSSPSTYYVSSETFTVNYGSRGPAYEHFYFEIVHAQLINNTIYKLELEDCFKHKNLKPLRGQLVLAEKNFSNSFSNKLDSGNYLWKMTSDSILLFFRKDRNYYYGFKESYERIGFSKAIFGNLFLSERKRKRQIKK